jgi:3-dehydroquinate synthase
MARVVQKTAELHLRHIATSGDPFEFGSARPLDFGHGPLPPRTALQLCARPWPRRGSRHCVDSTYAMLKGMIDPADATRFARPCRVRPADVVTLLDRADARGEPEVLGGIEQFREHSAAASASRCPALGAKFEVHRISLPLMKKPSACCAHKTMNLTATTVPPQANFRTARAAGAGLPGSVHQCRCPPR